MALVAPYVDIAQLLHDGGLGLVLGTDLFGAEWGDVDKQVLVLGTEAVPADLKDLYEPVSIQILIRGDKRDADGDVYTRAAAIRAFLLEQPECVTISGRAYKGFEESAALAALGKDENERFIYSANYLTNRNP